MNRGGAGADYVQAEAQDGGGTNNANFSTPVDGSKPRMQMYIWSSVPLTSPLTINSPGSIAGSMWAVESGFSTNNKLANVGHKMGDLLLVNDSGGSTHLGCGALSNGGSLPGKIAVVDRGTCDFVTKVKNMQNLGAIAAIVINNVEGDPFIMGGTDNTITIPAVMVSLQKGNLLKTTMLSNTVNVSLDPVPMITPDGDFDSGVICHEYTHGISMRLTGGPNNVSCLNNQEQMGEGWSDYLGLMLTTKWNTATETDRRGIGTYVLGEPTDGYGIRTYPYTTDTLINPFTYADVANAPLTNGIPSVHYIGSIWCTMLWDMTWNIIHMAGTSTDMYHGTAGNNIALQLVIDGMKLQPCSPGFVDGRDAILLADKLDYG
ncbi:MAG TPA: M36 family metallopeptidase, partial [Saprospiraceae bacterium]|nr:M36 family metallopeptidase [Saprospiraceae bacterium]